MKLFKYSILALALAAGFSSCKDDDKYEPGAASDGVYFPTDDALEVDLDRNLTYFEVTVARLGETAAATYGLTGIADDEVFTLPTSVSFAEGETSTKVKIDYVQANMGMDKPYEVSLAFAEGTKLSSYGFDRLEMAVTLPAPWTTIGKGTYRDLYVLALSKLSEDPDFNPSWECEIQQHDIDPLRFRWVHPYGENFAKYVSSIGAGELEPGEYDDQEKFYVEFLCDQKSNKVVVPLQSLGFQFFADGVMSVCNEAGMYYPRNDYETIVSDPELAATCGEVTWKTVEDEETGEERTIPATVFSGKSVALVTFDGDGFYLGGEGYQWAAEGVELKDYDITLAYQGVLGTPDDYSYVLASVKLGADLANAVVGLVPTTDEQEAIDAVTNGEVDTQEFTENTPDARFDFDKSDDYVLAALGYNEAGDLVTTSAISFFVSNTSAPKEWKKLGTGVMVDGWICPSFSIGGVRIDPMDYAYRIEMEENIENPGIYRMIQPWTTPNFPGASLNDYEGDPVNILVDARNPEFVTIEPQFAGYYSVYDDGSSAAFWVTSLADFYKAQGATEAEIAAEELNNVIEEGEIYIVFPTFGQTDKVGDPAPAMDDCAYTFYGKTPYSDELEACPAIFVLPSAVNNAKAKVAMRNLESQALAKTRNTAFNIASRYNNAVRSAKVFKRAAKAKHLTPRF